MEAFEKSVREYPMSAETKAAMHEGTVIPTIKNGPETWMEGEKSEMRRLETFKVKWLGNI